MGQGLSEFAEWCLEVVVLHWHVIVVCGNSSLHFVEPRLSFGVCSTVIHVVAEEIGAAAKFHQCHRIGIFRINIWTAVVCLHHASTKFAGEIRILLVTLVESLLLLAKLFGSNGSGGTERLEVECLEVVAGRLLNRPFPKSVCIVAI